jgi:hypothetical protein
MTHLIPEVRPLPGQRFALFKNAPGVFVRVAGHFPLLAVFPALFSIFIAANNPLGECQCAKSLA